MGLFLDRLVRMLLFSIPLMTGTDRQKPPMANWRSSTTILPSWCILRSQAALDKKPPRDPAAIAGTYVTDW